MAIGGSGTCVGNTGIDVQSAAANGNFFPIPGDTTYTASAAWVAGLAGIAFTAATFADVQ